MRRRLLYGALLPVACSIAAAVAVQAQQDLRSAMNARLDALANRVAWAAFVNRFPERFPPAASTSGDGVVHAEEEDFELGGRHFAVGIGYRQVLIRAPLARVRRMLSSPDLFKDLYGLDADATVGGLTGDRIEREHVREFRARILKRLPVLPDQDYMLRYSGSDDGPAWFQRVRLVEDLEGFALRANLQVLEPVNGGVVLRSISMLYPRDWLVRALTTQIRAVTRTELAKMNATERCAAENPAPRLTPAIAAACWAQASR